MNEVERTVLTCLQAGNYDDALAAIKNVTDRDDAALFTSMVVELSEASAYSRALCEGRLAAAPPDHDNPFCITLKKLQKMLWPAEMWDKAANSTKNNPAHHEKRLYDKDIETGLLSCRAFLWNARAFIEDSAHSH